ncbi:MAG: ATP-dependent acyl-CoA ligase [Porticoccaceae bacterium]|nr:ATP-dependent acyl-CoA ligase [Pseudomonadales bacterium]MCP5171128.1 ATP-dependent acyl-CoA ligase [Pseudomonadales bacterium]MCP5301635.1 ATP-dependent acyl-CoA ligase [Pseudomonadales bacterium]
MGAWDDKFVNAESKWQSWQMKKHATEEKILTRIVQEKAENNPDHIVFEFIDTKITFAQLDSRTNKIANGFGALGVGHSDKVAVMLPNCPEFLYCWFGLNRLGAVNVPINIAQRGDGLAHQINQSDSVGIVIDEEYLEHLASIAELVDHLRFVVVLPSGSGVTTKGISRAELLSFEQLLDHSERPPEVELKYNELSSIIFTSGTTGPSKGVMISHHYWYEVCKTAQHFARYTEDDVLYNALPFFHVAAIVLSVGPAIMAEAKAVHMKRFSVSRMFDDCRKYNCTVANYIGSIIPLLMKQEPREDDGDNPLRLMLGAAAPVGIWDDFERRFNTRLQELYGLTECLLCLFNPYDERRPGSCGKAITGYSVKIVDENDIEVPNGTVGEIITRPEKPYVGTPGYYKMPEATLELTKNLWYHTGDLGYRDDDGYFYFSDRKKQAIRRRGENISSFEVEAGINAHDAVLESCVVGVPSELGEEEVKAVIVMKEGYTVSEVELVQWCESRMPYFAVPRYIAFRDSLPKTPSDRVEKFKLKKEGVTSDCWDRELVRK